MQKMRLEVGRSGGGVDSSSSSHLGGGKKERGKRETLEKLASSSFGRLRRPSCHVVGIFWMFSEDTSMCDCPLQEKGRRTNGRL